MRRDGEPCRLAALYGVFEFGEGVVAVDACECQVVRCLQADFHDDWFLAVFLCEVFDLFVFEAVGARADGKSCDFLVLDNRVDDSAQVLEWGVRVRVRLQVGEDSCVRVLLPEFRHELFELFLDAYFRLVKDGTETAVVAVTASGKAFGAVQVRASHAAIERELAHLEVVGEEFKKKVAVGCVVHCLKIKRIIAFVLT